MWRGARSSCCRARTGRARRACCARVPGCCPSSTATPSSSVTICVLDGHRCARQVGLLGHRTALYDDLSVTDNVRFWTRAAKGDQTQRRRGHGAAGAGRVAWPPFLSGVCRRDSVAGCRSRCCWRGVRNSGCSMSPMPVSTKRRVTRSTASCTTPRPPARRCSWPHTSSTGPRRWPNARCTSPVAM